MPRDRQFDARKFTDLRLDAGLTLRALASRCAERGQPVHATTLSQLERGKVKRPTPETLYAIAGGLGVRPTELLREAAA